jgi:hypothetical protein
MPVTPEQLAQLQQIQQAGAPQTAPTGQAGTAVDPLAAQADALSKQIAEMLVPRKPTLGQSVMQGMHGAAIGAMAPPGQNPANAVIADQQMQREAQQNAIQNRIGLLNQIRQQQYQQGMLGEEKKRTGIEQQQADTAATRVKQTGELAKQKNQGALAEKGLKIALDSDTGEQTIVPIPEAELTPAQKAKLDKDRAATDLVQYTEEWRKAQADLAKAKNDPTSAAYKQAEERVKVSGQNAATAAGRLGLSKEEFSAKYLGMGPDNQPLAGVSYDENGRPIGPAVTNAGKAPAQLTVQSAAADRTKLMTATIRQIVKEKPYLIGPALGRVNQAAQVIGGNPLQNADDERDASLLAGHLAYLFANELQGTMTGRPNPTVVQTLKAASAQQKDDPAVLEGFLRSADNNAEIALKTGQQYGVKKVGGNAPPLKPQTGTVRVKAPDGTTGTWDLSKGPIPKGYTQIQ